MHKSQATNPLTIRDFTMTASFHIIDWVFDEAANKLSFHYRCSAFGEFIETITLPLPTTTEALQKQKPLIDMLHAIIGVSYYKLNAAQNLKCDHLIFQKNTARILIQSLYQEGLGEFFIRADLPYPYQQDWAFPQKTTDTETRVMATPLMPHSAIVAFGGGKDSYVAQSLIEKAGCSNTIRASVSLSPAIEKTIQSASDNAVTFIQRRLDKSLLDPKSKALQQGHNGHVPVTAINSFILLVFASLTNKQAVIFANEKSADEATMMHKTETGDIMPVNHQYSKSAACENDINVFLQNLDGDYPSYFSILRPLDEQKIGYLFAQQTEHHPYFLSCNKNFTHDNKSATHQPWCGNCPKCAFTALILSPYLSKEKAIAIFGGDFVNGSELHPYYTEILGLSDQKPWECVGTITESRASLITLYEQKRLEKNIWTDDFMTNLIALQAKKNDTNNDIKTSLPQRIMTVVEHELAEYP